MYLETLVEFAEYRRDSSDTSGPRTSSYMERESLIDVMNMKQSGTETGTICSGTSGVQNRMLAHISLFGKLKKSDVSIYLNKWTSNEYIVW